MLLLAVSLVSLILNNIVSDKKRNATSHSKLFQPKIKFVAYSTYLTSLAFILYDLISIFVVIIIEHEILYLRNTGIGWLTRFLFQSSFLSN